MGTVDFPAGFFERAQPERPAGAGLDEAAIAAIRDLYSDLGIDGRVLDLCGSSGEHFDVPPDELVGTAGDPDRQAALRRRRVRRRALLRRRGLDDPPGRDVRRGRARAAPRRALRRHVRDGPARAGVVRGWASTDDAGRVRIVRTYFALAPAFGPAESDLRTSLTGAGDRLWAVWAAKRG